MSTPQPIEVRKVAIKHVSDASGLEELIDQGIMEADRVIAVIGKTEGNGGVNDYTRIIADRAFREVLVSKGTRPMSEVKQIPIVWSGGTDGVISPHATIFATTDPSKAPKTDEPRISVGFAMSEHILPEEIGYMGMVNKVAAGVKEAMAKVTFAEAALGSEISVPTLSGENVKVRIAPGTANGRTLRVKGHGLAKKNGGHGDLYVTIDISVPQRLEERERALLEEFAALTANADPRVDFFRRAKE